MSLIIIGGHSRNVGKTSLVAGLISALREFDWTAIKITQYGHGICSAHGEPCDCAPSALDHEWAINEEHDRSGHSDTSRFLLAGAQHALWVRTREGMLAEAMPELRHCLAAAKNVILESNSAMQFLCPDVYLSVLDPGTADFKRSARLFLDRADAIVLHSTEANAQWEGVSLKPLRDKPRFSITAPQYCTPEIANFVRTRLQPGAPSYRDFR